jgi:hypothetical protein
MRRTAVFAAAVATVAWMAGVSAQTPNFAGKWVMQPDTSDMGGGGGGGRMGGGRMGGRGGGMGGWGQEFTITQDASTLKVERTVGGNPMTETYKLDGSESKNTMTMGRGGPVEVTSTAKWDGGKLMINSTQEMNMGGNAMTITTKRAISLDASGNLVVETTRSGRNGDTTSKAVYKKGLP